MKVDGQRVPGAVLCDLCVHDEVLDFDLAEGLDGVCDPSQQRWYVSLALTSGISLAEVFYSPRCPLAHRPSLLSCAWIRAPMSSIRQPPARPPDSPGPRAGHHALSPSPLRPECCVKARALQIQLAGDCLLVSRGGDQDLRKEPPVGLCGFSLALPGQLAGKGVQLRVLLLSRPAAGQVRTHLRDHPLGVPP